MYLILNTERSFCGSLYVSCWGFGNSDANLFIGRTLPEDLPCFLIVEKSMLAWQALEKFTLVKLLTLKNRKHADYMKQTICARALHRLHTLSTLLLLYIAIYLTFVNLINILHRYL